MERSNHQATVKELRQFGLVVGGVFAVIGLWPLVVRSESPRVWAMALGSLLMVLGAVAPQSLTQGHAGWMKVGHILGAINTKIILGILYYLLITPMGLVMRLMGKDPMQQVLTQGTDTYRILRAPRPRQHMRNQF
ncbi:MAG: sxtJ [Nitrospira sp.]|nr:sxtJ [Nitrospira sp.]